MYIQPTSSLPLGQLLPSAGTSLSPMTGEAINWSGRESPQSPAAPVASEPLPSPADLPSMKASGSFNPTTESDQPHDISLPPIDAHAGTLLERAMQQFYADAGLISL